MTGAGVQLSLIDSRSSDANEGTRREQREEVVRHVEYCPYPRVTAGQHLRVGFTRDLSPSGMCFRVEAPERIGSLLRVTIREVDGQATLERIARIAWSTPTLDGGLWIGLTVLESGRAHPIRVRHKPRAANSVEVA